MKRLQHALDQKGAAYTGPAESEGERAPHRIYFARYVCMYIVDSVIYNASIDSMHDARYLRRY